MAAARTAAVVILANEACLASRGVTPAEIIDALAAEGLTAAWLALPADQAGLDALTARLCSERPAVLVAAGGDGTVHAAANLAVPLGLPLGVIPLGTANDFARGLHLPMQVREAARLIAWDAPIRVDVGAVNQEIFVNAAHLGLGVETAKRTDPQLKKWLGPLAYGMAAVQAWHEAEPLVMELCQDDGCTRVLASQLLVGAGMYFGGGNLVGKAAPDSGLLEVIALGGELGPAQALGLAAALKLGTLADLPQALHVRAARLEVKLSRPAEVNLDGELLALGQELHFELLPGALAVYAPSRAPVAALEVWGAGVELA
jgi:YegS/Rv2252/BmrU family lipid kinase